MWRFEPVGSGMLPGIERCLEAINRQRDYFAKSAPVMVARAPGRLDLMGGIADYSGSLVLELPLACATYVAVQEDSEPVLTVLSDTVVELDAEPRVSLPMEALVPAQRPLSYAEARTFLGANPRRSWVAYLAGALIVLQRERGVRFDHGLRLLVHSEVPAGKGVSSSAALEVSAMRAICALRGVDLEGRDLAILCQQVENLVVGAPCGIMDQMTAACGEQGYLLALLCQPAELQNAVALPADIEIWGIDSGIRHAVSGADYGSVRVGAFMGYRIIAELAGLQATSLPGRQVRINDPRWGGYLANISPSEWEMCYSQRVPVALDGASFLERYGGLTDSVTHVDPAHTYAVRQPAAHPIYEHQRVRLFRALLQSRPLPLDDERLALLGELMYQSHASYSACGLGSEGTDRLVELVRKAGPADGLYGAKITGGGSGGTVAVLARRGARPAIERIAACYEQETGQRTTIMGGSSPGAMRLGVQRLLSA